MTAHAPAGHPLAIARLHSQADAQPERDFLRFADGCITYASFRQQVVTLAGQLHGLGIRPGSLLPGLFPNSADCLRNWFAALHLGAVWAPLNTEFRGQQLVDALALIDSDTLLLDAAFLPVLEDILPQLPGIRRLLLWQATGDECVANIEIRPIEQVPPGATPPCAAVSPTAPALTLFTSGSTGVSKAVLLSHGYLVGQGSSSANTFRLNTTDVLYCPYPLYHWDACIGTVMAALVSGCTAALGHRFSVSRFWQEVRSFQATVFDFMGATLSFLYQQPEQEDDAQNPVRLAWGVPMPEFKTAFEQRFDLQLIEGYGSTESGIPIYQQLDKAYPPGCCGEIAPQWQLRIVDPQGRDLPPGAVGEIVSRPDDPNNQMTGYLNRPEDTAQALRGGWYHSGDLGRLDQQGRLFFCGRIKDVIRRRGENIAAAEVEQAIEKHPAVAEVAAFPLDSEYSEEEVAVALVLHHQAHLAAKELRTWCDGRMAAYMIPEHVFLCQELPRTATGKVAKAKLRAEFQNPVRASQN